MTKNCDCGGTMVVDTSYCMASYPGQYNAKCDKCGSERRVFSVNNIGFFDSREECLDARGGAGGPSQALAF